MSHNFKKGDRVKYAFQGKVLKGTIVRVNSRNACFPTVKVKHDDDGREINVTVTALHRIFTKAETAQIARDTETLRKVLQRCAGINNA